MSDILNPFKALLVHFFFFLFLSFKGLIPFFCCLASFSTCLALESVSFARQAQGRFLHFPHMTPALAFFAWNAALLLRASCHSLPVL